VSILELDNLVRIRKLSEEPSAASEIDGLVASARARLTDAYLLGMPDVVNRPGLHVAASAALVRVASAALVRAASATLVRAASAALVAVASLGGCYESHLIGEVRVPDDCVATTEVCNGVDDDCDGFVDDGTDRALGCEAAVCVEGECVCPPERICGAECVDTSRSFAHCGGCDMPCLPGLSCVDGACCVADVGPVDMLFMVDNSNSMDEEQASLAAAFPVMMTIFASGDSDGDGVADFAPIDDLHVGVVTSDLGTDRFRLPTCSELGDDGVLRTVPGSLDGCESRYPSFLSFTPGSSTDALAMDFACISVAGTGGCGFEQQLEALLKALTPSASPTRFFRDTRGHGDGANAGFLRPDSVLAVIVVTDEDDCSVADPALVDPSSETYAGDLNLRCFRYPEAVHPVERYVDGLLALRARPANLVFAQITGVPVELTLRPDMPPFEAILAHPDMQERVDASGTRLARSCAVSGRGAAYPPRRIVETAQHLAERGAQPVVGSLCQSDFTDTVVAIADRVSRTVFTACE
jgi:hypothetical protein